MHTFRPLLITTANGHYSWLKLHSAALFQSWEQLNRHVWLIWPLLGGNFAAMYFNIFACIAEPACLSACLFWLSVLGATWNRSGAWMQSPPISHCWHPHVMACQISPSLLLFREVEELCCWHQPALSKAACVKECVCLLFRYFHNHIFFSTSTHWGILRDVPRRLSHAPLDTNVDKYWACCPDLHTRTPTPRSSLNHPPPKLLENHIHPPIRPSGHPASQPAAACK